MRTGIIFIGNLIAAALSLNTCPDVLYHDTGVGGSDATAIRNVTDAGECCALCHSDFHDECAAWIFGGTGHDAKLKYPPHNCAIMAQVNRKRHVPGHVSGIVHQAPSPPPSPSSRGKPCRADIDCDIQGSTSWRCQHDPKQESSKDSNCHLPGPGTKGNATCSCSTPMCSKGPTGPKKKSSRQYLMIGDSISLGMEGNVASALSAHGIELTHNPGNAASTNEGSHCLVDWLQTKPPAKRIWDVISFQFGLHDLAFDTERISVEQYKSLLTDITNVLVQEQKQHGTKLIWVATTPVPTVPTYGPACKSTSSCLNPPRFDDDVVLFNSMATEVIKNAMQQGANIATLDLYSFVLKKCGGKGYASCDGFQLPKNVHFTAAGWTALGHEMASAVLASTEPLQMPEVLQV